MLLQKTLLSICSVWLLCSFHPLNALIVPQELPSLLSVVYSNIPPIKKGTDSRLGFGFRLGEHADFQVLVELGPQKETRPIGDKDGDSSFNKRHINEADQNALIRKQLRQELKRQQEQRQELSSTERIASNWLENWSQDMNAVKKKPSKSKSKEQQNAKKHQKLELNFAPTIPVLPSKSLQQLQLLYKMATTTTSTPFMDDKKTVEGSRALRNSKFVIESLKGKEEITKQLMNVSLEEGE